MVDQRIRKEMGKKCYRNWDFEEVDTCTIYETGDDEDFNLTKHDYLVQISKKLFLHTGFSVIEM